MSVGRSVYRICWRAPHLRRNLSSSSSKEDPAPGSKITRLPNRSLVSVKGKDGGNFLQGLVTADVAELRLKGTLYSMLLNAQGRILYDIILYHRGEGDVVMECDTTVQADLIKHLKRYALRSEVMIEGDFSCDVWVAYPALPEAALGDAVIADCDPRVRLLGTRILSPVSTSGTKLAPSLLTSAPEDYQRHRLEVGVAEGPAEVPVGACFPLEYNGDYMNGVSFSKGCYIGQELTARTHHSGVVRKRVVPVTFDERAGVEISSGTKIMSESGKNIGKLVTRLGGLGLALLRVKEMKGSLSMQGEGGREEFTVTAHTPSWWPS